MLSDGCADAAFDETNVYGFDNRESASNLLAEDEYVRFDSMTEERELEIGAKKADISPPAWGGHVGATNSGAASLTFKLTDKNQRP